MTLRPKLTFSYRILDSKKRVLFVGKETGISRNLVIWKLLRWAEKRFGKDVEVHIYRTKKEA